MTPIKNAWNTYKQQVGMTLIEVLVVLMIICVVGAGVASTLTTSWSSQQTITDQNEMQRRAQLAVNRIVDDLRGMTFVTTNDPHHVQAEFKEKGNLSGASLAYAGFSIGDGGTLVRDRMTQSGTITTGEVICSGVTNLSFGYFKPNATNPMTLEPATLASTIESIMVSVTLTSGNCSATETSWVKLRNRYE